MKLKKKKSAQSMKKSMGYPCALLPTCSVASDSSQPREPEPARLLCPWDGPDQNTAVGYRAPPAPMELLERKSAQWTMAKVTHRAVFLATPLSIETFPALCRYLACSVYSQWMAKGSICRVPSPLQPHPLPWRKHLLQAP